MSCGCAIVFPGVCYIIENVTCKANADAGHGDRVRAHGGSHAGGHHTYAFMEELPVLMANATRSYRSRLSSKKFSPSQTRTSGSEALRNFNCGNIQTSFKNSSGLVYRLQQRKRVWTQKFRTEGAGKLIQLGFSKLEVGNPTPVAARMYFL